MSKRALIVEDDSNIAELLRLYLGRDGFEVMITGDGSKAEGIFDLFTPDVVLLDIMLPGKDGWQICRDIRKKSSTPIIMLTAKGETTDKVSGLEMGADDYVTKPFDVKELIASDAEDYVRRVEQALALRDDAARREEEKKEALAADWLRRAETVTAALRKRERQRKEA